MVRSIAQGSGGIAGKGREDIIETEVCFWRDVGDFADIISSLELCAEPSSTPSWRQCVHREAEERREVLCCVRQLTPEQGNIDR